MARPGRAGQGVSGRGRIDDFYDRLAVVEIVRLRLCCWNCVAHFLPISVEHIVNSKSEQESCRAGHYDDADEYETKHGDPPDMVMRMRPTTATTHFEP